VGSALLSNPEDRLGAAARPTEALDGFCVVRSHPRCGLGSVWATHPLRGAGPLPTAPTRLVADWWSPIGGCRHPGNGRDQPHRLQGSRLLRGRNRLRGVLANGSHKGVRGFNEGRCWKDPLAIAQRSHAGLPPPCRMGYEMGGAVPTRPHVIIDPWAKGTSTQSLKPPSPNPMASRWQLHRPPSPIAGSGFLTGHKPRSGEWEPHVGLRDSRGQRMDPLRR
jgi:hypothetical protein